ncbi:MAG TPA: PAS domain-containing protein, partial [Candidatus Sulfopaludibacter sp.]|nr:PAS domain-containing protein [Candidatus Sulfopaludibacter sp.]
MNNNNIFDLALAGLGDSAISAIYRVTGDGLMASWNPAIERVFGYQESEWLGLPSHTVFTDADVAADIPQQEMEEARRSGRVDAERCYRRKDGSTIYLEGRLLPLGDSAGEIGGFVRILLENDRQDLLLRLQQSQAALRKSEERLSLALDAGGGVGTWDWDVELDIVYADPQFARLFSVDPNQAE